MSSIFLSHTSVDKPFVEKLATDLKRIGVNVWFDKWDIKIGESITWKIEEGIRQNEYLGIILSPEALLSEWVKSELSAAWMKQMSLKKVVVLPLLYRRCDIPLFLADRRYANFSMDYHTGLRELADVLGVAYSETMNEENWRLFALSRTKGWQEFRTKEFEQLVTVLVKRAKEYNWSCWVTRTKNPHCIRPDAWTSDSPRKCVTVKLEAKTHQYVATLQEVSNPAHLKRSDFGEEIGSTINEVEEFVWRQMEDFCQEYGKPSGKASYLTDRYLSPREKETAIQQFLKKWRWNQDNALM